MKMVVESNETAKLTPDSVVEPLSSWPHLSKDTSVKHVDRFNCLSREHICQCIRRYCNVKDTFSTIKYN